MRTTIVALLAATFFLACSEPKKIGGEAMPLSPAERQTVEQGVQRARTGKAWTSAWNQAVDAGLGQRTLEKIATETLGDNETGVATSMFAALSEKFGTLSPEARADVTRLRKQAMAEERWERAAEIEILAADAPFTGSGSYPGAWAVYEEAPAAEAAAVLELIDEARRDALEKRDGD